MSRPDPDCGLLCAARGEAGGCWSRSRQLWKVDRQLASVSEKGEAWTHISRTVFPSADGYPWGFLVLCAKPRDSTTMDFLYGHDRKLGYLDDEPEMVDFLDSNDIFNSGPMVSQSVCSVQ